MLTTFLDLSKIADTLLDIEDAINHGEDRGVPALACKKIAEWRATDMDLFAMPVQKFRNFLIQYGRPGGKELGKEIQAFEFDNEFLDGEYVLLYWSKHQLHLLTTSEWHHSLFTTWHANATNPEFPAMWNLGLAHEYFDVELENAAS